MYVVKVGKWYVSGIEESNGYIIAVYLSKELSKGFSKKLADKIAESTDGEVIEMLREVSNG